jgi:tetratricopeptide (TPR) repeat protein
MEFNQDNKVVQLCAQGMEMEGQGRLTKAGDLFNEAWNAALNDFEKFIAAHYVARHQKNVSDKLKWDEVALKHALNINDKTIKETLPSLYLNIGKCYEDLDDLDNAKNNYQAGFSFISFLPDTGYGNMIKAGIANGLDRVK